MSMKVRRDAAGKTIAIFSCDRCMVRFLTVPCDHDYKHTRRLAGERAREIGALVLSVQNRDRCSDCASLLRPPG